MKKKGFGFHEPQDILIRTILPPNDREVVGHGALRRDSTRHRRVRVSVTRAFMVPMHAKPIRKEVSHEPHGILVRAILPHPSPLPLGEGEWKHR